MTVDLSLPEPPREKGGRFLPAATFVLALAAVALLAVLLLRPAPAGAAPEAGPPALDRNLAETLEKRTLWREAAALWEKLARSGEDLFRAGKCRMLAGEPERAARDLLAAEAAGLPDDLAGESSRLVLEAYAMLGRFDVRNEALERRTGGKEEAEGVVARVGKEEVRRDELMAAVRDEEASRLLATGAFDRDALDRAVAARAADPKLLRPTLDRMLTERALALEALAKGLGDDPALARRQREVRRQLLANLLLQKRLMEGVQVSDADLKDHYEAHRDRYTEPAAVRFAWGPDADSLEEVEGWHEKGAAFPGGLPRSAEADALLFALSPGEVADRTVRIGDREVLLKQIEMRPARTLPFEEARDRVRKDLLARKRMDTIQALRDEVRAKHPIEITDEKLKEAGSSANGR